MYVFVCIVYNCMLMESSNKLDVLEFKYVFCFVVKEEGYFCVVSFKVFFLKVLEFWEMNYDLMVIFVSS